MIGKYVNVVYVNVDFMANEEFRFMSLIVVFNIGFNVISDMWFHKTRDAKSASFIAFHTLFHDISLLLIFTLHYFRSKRD